MSLSQSLLNDPETKFPQDFLYLSGVLEPDSALVLYGKGRPDRAILFVPRRDPGRELWDGPRSGKDGAAALTGIDRVHSTEELSVVLKSLNGALNCAVGVRHSPPSPPMDRVSYVLQSSLRHHVLVRWLSSSPSSAPSGARVSCAEGGSDASCSQTPHTLSQSPQELSRGGAHAGSRSHYDAGRYLNCMNEGFVHRCVER